jgi:hypothetical protein
LFPFRLLGFVPRQPLLGKSSDHRVFSSRGG